MSLLVISPHRDDAAFSCGIALQLASEAYVPATIVNIFVQSDYAPFAPAEGVQSVSAVRLQEDEQMLQVLNSTAVLRDLQWADAPVRRGVATEQTVGHSLDELAFTREVARLAEELRARLDGATCVLVPLANKHLDHKVARAAAERCCPAERLAYYEDLPYFARLTPEERRATLQLLVPPSTQSLSLVHRDGRSVKRQLASCYPSQVEAGTVKEIFLYAEQSVNKTSRVQHVSNIEVGAETVYAGPVARALLESMGAMAI